MFRVGVYVLGLFGAAAATLGFFVIYRQLGHASSCRKSEGRKPLRISAYFVDNQEIALWQLGQLNFSRCGEKNKSDNQVSVEELKHLISLLPALNTMSSLKIMKTLIRFSNYSENIPSFRSTKVLDDLFSLLNLGGDGEFLRLTNVHVLNLFANLIIDGNIREHLKAHIGFFFDVTLPSLQVNEVIAMLRLLGNFSMMDDTCVTVGMHFPEVFEFVAGQSDGVRRQAWTILLNLSCNMQCVDVILGTATFDGFKASLRELLTEKNDVILLKSIKFLCNLYQGLRIQKRNQFSRDSILNELLSAKENLILQTTLFLPYAVAVGEVFADAQHLLRVEAPNSMTRNPPQSIQKSPTGRLYALATGTSRFPRSPGLPICHTY
ncbi:hypothetical protein ECG_01430 [Echinococcus granulosus]|uniref:Arm_2 domain containing protein n=1 Tax=Echinococcus granulosus TaxID=6210 RepID=A0A068WB57_ECHGR|nr:hypothetical protein ECG_01430 [Echinococcus granulosus]CDS15647.1 Arm_2 domain containing protein [Echinococcus granulosus]